MTITAPPASARPGPRLLVITQFALAGTALLGFAAVYLAGLAEAGSHAALVGTPVDPKDGIPFGTHPLNPFYWLYSLVVLAVLVGWVPAAGAAVAGAVLLGQRDVRADRRRMALLAAGTLVCALFVALLFLPISNELLTWFAD